MAEVLALAIGTAVLAGLIANLLVPLVTRVALAIRAVDYPGGRKVQVMPVPRLGGVAIVAGLGLAAGAVALARWNAWGPLASRSELLTLVLTTCMVFLVGVIDDILGVSSFKKFLVELSAASLLVLVGWSFEAVSVPGRESLYLGVLAPVLSVLWIVGVTNAVNLLDGLDGLAGGVVAIIASSLLIYAFLQGDPGSVILMAATAGACLGFLRHNWAPARIFMGDSGSLALGFLLAAVSIHSAIKAPAAVAILVPLLALGLPVIDTVLVMLVRFLARPKGPLTRRFLRMFRADRNHLHHLLLRYGTSRKRVVGWIYGAVVAFCALALSVAVTRNPFLGAVLLAVELLTVVFMRRLGLRAEARRISEHQRQELRADLLEAKLGEELPSPSRGPWERAGGEPR